jgi:hypothetical protein
MKDTMTITVSGAIHDYCSREPGKVESAARHDIPVLLQGGLALLARQEPGMSGA